MYVAHFILKKQNGGFTIDFTISIREPRRAKSTWWKGNIFAVNALVASIQPNWERTWVHWSANRVKLVVWFNWRANRNGRVSTAMWPNPMKKSKIFYVKFDIKWTIRAHKWTKLKCFWRNMHMCCIQTIIYSSKWSKSWQLSFDTWAKWIASFANR